MNTTTTIASITVADQAWRQHVKMPPSITQNRDTGIEVSGDRVSFVWNNEHHTLPLSMVGVAYAKPKPVAETPAEETKTAPATAAATKAKTKGRPGRKPGFKVKKPAAELDQALAGAPSAGKRNNGTLTAN